LRCHSTLLYCHPACLPSVEAGASQHAHTYPGNRAAYGWSLLGVYVRAGAESMIVRLALGAHSKQVGVSLDRSLALGEVAFKQHISLQVRHLLHGLHVQLLCFCMARLLQGS
jgi:hypothetical protein